MRERTRELIEQLRRMMAICHEESGTEDVRGNQTRRELAELLRGARALHAKLGKRPSDTLRYMFRFYLDRPAIG